MNGGSGGEVRAHADDAGHHGARADQAEVQDAGDLKSEGEVEWFS